MVQGIRFQPQAGLDPQPITFQRGSTTSLIQQNLNAGGVGLESGFTPAEPIQNPEVEPEDGQASRQQRLRGSSDSPLDLEIPEPAGIPVQEGILPDRPPTNVELFLDTVSANVRDAGRGMNLDVLI